MSYHRGIGDDGMTVVHFTPGVTPTATATSAPAPASPGSGMTVPLVIGAVGVVGYLLYRKFRKKA